MMRREETGIAPTPAQLRQHAAYHSQCANSAQSSKAAADHREMAMIFETEADLTEREDRLEQLKVKIAMLEGDGKYEDARRTRELLAAATETIGLTRMGERRRLSKSK